MRGVTGLGAGRGRCNARVIVSRGLDDGVDIAVAADGAGVRGVTGLGAGRGRHDDGVVVTLCRYEVVAVDIAAALAGVLRVAVLFTGRRYDGRSEVVTKRFADGNGQVGVHRVAVAALDVVVRRLEAGDLLGQLVRGDLLREAVFGVELPQEDRVVRVGAAGREGSRSQIDVHHGDELGICDLLCGLGSCGLLALRGADAALDAGAFEVGEVLDDGVCVGNGADNGAIGEGFVADDFAEVEAVGHFALGCVADDARSIVPACLDRAGVVAGRDLAVGGQVRNDTSCAGAGRGDVTGVDAAGDGAGLVAARNVADDTGAVAPAGDVAAVRAVGNIQAVVGAADDTADRLPVVARRALDGNVNVRVEVRQVGIVRAADDTANVSIVNALIRTGDNGAVDRQVLNLRAVGGVGAGDPAEQAAIERCRGRAAVVDEKVIDGVILAIEGTGEVLGDGADGRPLVTGEVDVRRQDAGDLRAAAVDLLGKPSEFRTSADEVNAVVVGLRLRGGLAVPSVLRRLADGELDGKDAVFNLCRVGRAEGEGAARADIAELFDRIGIRAVAELERAALFGGHCLVVTVGERGSKAVDRVAVFVHGDEIDIVVDLRIDFDRNVCQTACNKADADRGEVRADAGVGHVVQRVKGACGGVHTAGDVATCDGVGRLVRAFGEGDVSGQSDCDGRLVHLLILTKAALEFIFTGRVVQVQLQGVEDTGNLVDAAIQAVEGKRDLVAGHDGLTAVRGVLHGDAHLRHTNQTVGRAGGIKHLDDDGAAERAGRAEGQEGGLISAVRARCEVGPVGECALQAAVGGDDGVADLHALGCLHGEVQRGGLVGVEIVPRVVVVIPIRAAAAGGAAVKDDGRVCGTGCLVCDDEHAGAFGVVCGEEACVRSGGVCRGVHINGVVGDGNDVRAGGLDVDPVAFSVAAIDLLNVCVIALQHLNIELRLGHDVADVGVDQLPHTERADTVSVAHTLKAAVAQEDLKVGLVAVDDLCAELAEVVGLRVGRRVRGKGDGLFRLGTETGQPTGLSDVNLVLVDQTPCVVAVALGNAVGIGGHAGRLVLRSLVRLNRLGVEVVVLEEQGELRARGRGDVQLHRVGDADALGHDVVGVLRVVVDLLVKHILFRVGRISIDVVKRSVICLVGQEGESGVVAAEAGVGIGRTGVDHAAGDGHDHLDMVVVHAKVFVLFVLGSRIDADNAEIDVVAAAAVDVLLHRQRQALTAEVDVVGFGLGVPAVAARGVAAGA